MASLIELKSLSSLTVLEMHVPKIYLLPHNLLFPHLSRFSISIGYKPPPCDNIHSKLLFLGEIDARRPLQQCITFLLKETEHLSLQRISGLKNVVDSLDKDGFRNLKCLFVEGCNDMEYIVTGNELNEDGGVFPKLETLTVEGEMDNLKVICHGPPSHYSFRHLKVLKLFELSGLWNFWDDHDMHSNQPFFNEKMKFPTLEELEIWAVGGIVELWNLSDVEEEVQAFPRLVSLILGDLRELRSIWRSKNIVIHRSFRSLKSLRVFFCPKLEILCPFSVAAGIEQLENLECFIQ
ncbi:hypothetical protein Nepgr_033778 [Nepenthes gracilis]|uniref:Disease resistance protein At4g27190-like leucine-rich repeats domain-containing protein n=1 Tax=Nepenthes gracilis TaxID=150966 RepID=A0AAD3Y8Y4_NEPGR|nr:hypothetical protein Nepgr_033778 [Nepenthes gracilis]